MSSNKREFEQLPEWLQECWKLAPAIARKAEKYIEGLKPLSSDAVRALIEEAKAISENHPSKDARFFADKVYRFLSEHFI